MNIFWLDNCPDTAAQYHCDKHVVKMILESAQLLSTAHKILDGQETVKYSKSGARLKDWVLPDTRELVLYKASHVNHPCAIWCRTTHANYGWLYRLFLALGNEYSRRYAKQHLSITKLADELALHPDGIKEGELTTPALAMPDECKTNDPVESYRNYYKIHKADIAVWSHSETPFWWK